MGCMIKVFVCLYVEKTHKERSGVKGQSFIRRYKVKVEVSYLNGFTGFESI